MRKYTRKRIIPLPKKHSALNNGGVLQGFGGLRGICGFV